MREITLFDIGYADGMVPVLDQPEKTIPNGLNKIKNYLNANLFKGDTLWIIK